MSKEKKFLNLFEPNTEKLWRFILSFVKDRDEAKDILSETSIAAFENFDKLRKKEAFLSWIFTIARRKIMKTISQKEQIIGSAELELDEIAIEGYNPEKLADINQLYAALDELPIEQKEAIILTSIYGFSYEETAVIQKSPANTVNVRIYRGKQKLKKILEYSCTEVKNERS